MSYFNSQISSRKSESPRVLVIDDQPELIESIEDVLRQGNYVIFSALNGEDGLKLYREHQPMLVIFDLKMAKMTGIQFLDQIELKPLGPFSVIVLTGHGSDHEVEQCFEKGISAFIRKLFNIYEFQGLVRNTILLKETISEKKRRILSDDIIAAFDLESMNITYCLCGIPPPSSFGIMRTFI